MTSTVVCSFWVHRPRDFKDAPDYLAMLKILDASCRRFGLDHVVLSDVMTSPMLDKAGIRSYFADLPRNLMLAVTEIQAKWLESPYSEGVNTAFVGADCIIRKNIAGEVPDGDLAVILWPDHKKWRINTGFGYVPAASREKVAPLYRLIARDCGLTMCEDMVAFERALSPMPRSYGLHERRGLRVQFLDAPTWNWHPDTVHDKAEASYVLHFIGKERKPLFFDWAKKWDFAR